MMENVLDFYCKGGAKELKKFVYPIMIKFGGISQKDYDDFYSVAALVLWQVSKTYNAEKGISFEKFFESCLIKKFCSMMSKKNTIKRTCDRQSDFLDKNIGKDSRTLSETIISDVNLEEMVIQKVDGIYDEKVEKFLKSLSDVQRQMLEMKMEYIPVRQIKRELGLTNKQYEENMKAIRQNRMISIFNKRNI